MGIPNLDSETVGKPFISLASRFDEVALLHWALLRVLFAQFNHTRYEFFLCVGLLLSRRETFCDSGQSKMCAEDFGLSPIALKVI